LGDVLEEVGDDLPGDSRKGDECRESTPPPLKGPRVGYTYSSSSYESRMSHNLNMEYEDEDGGLTSLNKCEIFNPENLSISPESIRESTVALLYTAFNRSVFNTGKSDDITVMHVCMQMH
jgi:hypothetical protein